MDTPAKLDAPDYLAVTSSLAMELASELSDPSTIFDRHGFSEDDARVLLESPTFQKMVKEAKLEWDSDTNIQDRIKRKAQMALEELLLPTYHLAKDPRVPPPSRTDAVKLFERLSGAGKSSEDSGGTGPKYVLTINIGTGDGSPKEITGEVINNDESL
jgi:hypothetical protein